MKKFTTVIITALVFSIMVSCVKNDLVTIIQFSGEAQGTYYSITYFATDTAVKQYEIDSLLDDFDRSASIWVSNSTISKINNNVPGVIVDEHFAEVFKQSKRIWKATDGAFDITVGPLVNAWGFGFKKKIPIDQHLVDSLLKLVNFGGITLHNNKIIKADSNIQIDYNAIAQGYSVDLVGGFLKSRGIENYLIDIGGEVLAKGTKPEGKLWRVGIEKPSEDSDSERKLNATIEISNKAIATSGNYRKFYEQDGIRYSHTINPKTGYPAKHNLLSATVMTDSAAIADGYATALMVMGLEKAKIFLEKNPTLAAYLIFSNTNGEFETWATKNISTLVQE